MTDQIEALKRLGKLKADGLLTEAEFAAQKAALLGGAAAAAPPTSPGPTFAERFKHSRDLTRPMRRAYRKFMLTSMAVILVVGIGFLAYAAGHRQHEDANGYVIQGAAASEVERIDQEIRQNPIIAAYEAADDACKDTRESDPALSSACIQRDRLYPKTIQAGFCWGDDSEQSEAEKHWHRCPPLEGQ